MIGNQSPDVIFLPQILSHDEKDNKVKVVLRKVNHEGKINYTAKKGVIGSYTLI